MNTPTCDLFVFCEQTLLFILTATAFMPRGYVSRFRCKSRVGIGEIKFLAAFLETVDFLFKLPDLI